MVSSEDTKAIIHETIVFVVIASLITLIVVRFEILVGFNLITALLMLSYYYDEVKYSNGAFSVSRHENRVRLVTNLLLFLLALNLVSFYPMTVMGFSSGEEPGKLLMCFYIFFGYGILIALGRSMIFMTVLIMSDSEPVVPVHVHAETTRR